MDVTNNFFYYKSGVLRDTDCSPISLSHAIAAVAYSDDWFLVKNRSVDQLVGKVLRIS